MRTTCTIGVVSGPSIWRKLIATRRRSTLAETAGWARAGIGIPGTMPIRSSPETDSYMIRSVGASFHRRLPSDLRSFSSGTFTTTLTTTVTTTFGVVALITIAAFVTKAALLTVAFIAVAAFMEIAASMAGTVGFTGIAASMVVTAASMVVTADSMVGTAPSMVAVAVASTVAVATNA